MRMSTFLLTGALAAWLPLASEADPPAEVLHTRDRVFRIPFEIEPAGAQGPQAREVELHFSGNQGRQWKLANIVTPDQTAFTFQAPADGEYWFVIRTIDTEGKRLPAAQGPTLPEMKVLVDTTPPTVDLGLQAGRPGEVILAWRALEDHPAGDRLRIEVQDFSGPQPQWKLIPVPVGLEGQLALPAPRGPWAVRASVEDLAGNAAMKTLQMDASGRFQFVANEPPTARPEQAAGNVVQQAGYQRTESATNEFPRQTPSYTNAETSASAFDGSTNRGTDFANNSTGPGTASTRPAPAPQAPTAPPIAVNTLRFLLEYEVDATNAAGVKTVSVWGTLDRGQTWQLFGVDQDQRSPIEVQVPQAGLFGFRMIVEGLNGPPAGRPQRGEQPEIWVLVDTSAPIAQFSSIQPTDPNQVQEVEIRWEASDQQLAERPVSIYAAPTEQGPWSPVAENLPNTGSHRWRLFSQLPPQLHLRLVVTDAAGNRTTSESGDMMLADFMRNASRVQTARPTAPDPARERMFR